MCHDFMEMEIEIKMERERDIYIYFRCSCKFYRISFVTIFIRKTNSRRVLERDLEQFFFLSKNHPTFVLSVLRFNNSPIVPPRGYTRKLERLWRKKKFGK